MNKSIPAIVFVIVLGALIYALTEQGTATAANVPEFLSKEETIKGFEFFEKVNIKLLERIETIEKKLKITPPKDSLRLVKKEDKTH